MQGAWWTGMPPSAPKASVPAASVHARGCQGMSSPTNARSAYPAGRALFETCVRFNLRLSSPYCRCFHCVHWTPPAGPCAVLAACSWAICLKLCAPVQQQAPCCRHAPRVLAQMVSKPHLSTSQGGLMGTARKANCACISHRVWLREAQCACSSHGVWLREAQCACSSHGVWLREARCSYCCCNLAVYGLQVSPAARLRVSAQGKSSTRLVYVHVCVQCLPFL